MSVPPVDDLLAGFPAPDASGFSVDPSFASLVPGNAFADSVVVDSNATHSVALTVSENGTGWFSDEGPGLRGPAAFEARLCSRTSNVAPACLTTVPFAFGGSTETVDLTGFVATAGSPVPVQAIQRPFVSGVTVAGGTAATFIIGTGSNQLTAEGAGQLTLVSPMEFSVAPGVPLSGHWIGIAELELQFVPEPGVALLLMWGSGWLAWAGARKLRD